MNDITRELGYSQAEAASMAAENARLRASNEELRAALGVAVPYMEAHLHRLRARGATSADVLAEILADVRTALANAEATTTEGAAGAKPAPSSGGSHCPTPDGATPGANPGPSPAIEAPHRGNTAEAGRPDAVRRGLPYWRGLHSDGVFTTAESADMFTTWADLPEAPSEEQWGESNPSCWFDPRLPAIPADILAKLPTGRPLAGVVMDGEWETHDADHYWMARSGDMLASLDMGMRPNTRLRIDLGTGGWGYAGPRSRTDAEDRLLCAAILQHLGADVTAWLATL
jgi:cell pole-organizing protein PopZ